MVQNGGLFWNTMKIQRIAGRSSFSFPLEEDYDLFYYVFLQSALGEIYHAIPWDELVYNLKLKSKNWAISCFSDRKFDDQLNGNLDYQFYCLDSALYYILKFPKITSYGFSVAKF